MGMGAELLGSAPVFGECLVRCSGVLESLVGWSVVDVVRGVSGAPSLDRVDVVQPVSFAVMVSLAALWRAHGVVPDAVVGHSQGEIAAACVAGALSVEDAARVVALRSGVIGDRLAGRGGMVSLAVPVDGVDRWLGSGVELAAVNGPSSVVVAGEPAALDRLVVECEREGVRARRVAVDYASHTSQVGSVREELVAALDGLSAVAPRVPWLSTVTGEWVTEPPTARYWYRNLAQPVRFAEATATLLDQGHTVFVETSPHPVLTASIQDTATNHTSSGEAGSDQTGGVVVTGTLRRDDGSPERFLHSLAHLWTHGVTVDFTPTLPTHTVTNTRVTPPANQPTYPFQHHTRYWLTPTPHTNLTNTGLTNTNHPLLPATLHLPDTHHQLHTGQLTTTNHPWLTHHTINNTTLLPGTALI
ncbi:acyl transferase family protein, partial [Herbihabitans rhizosphaerae]